MNVVTLGTHNDVIVTCDPSERPGAPWSGIATVEWHVIPEDRMLNGGPWCVVTATYGLFQIPGFIGSLQSLPWLVPASVRLYVHGEQDDVYETVFGVPFEWEF